MKHQQALAVQTSPSTNSCVLYVMDEKMSLRDSGLIAAQQKALTAGCSLSVIYSTPELTSELQHPLQNIESELSVYAIPFMVLVGNPVDTINSIVQHTKPVQILRSTGAVTTKRLMNHPVAWPGTVIDVDSLYALKQSGALFC